MRLDGRRLGSLIGAAGGLAFVLGSAGGVAVPLVWRVLGVLLAVAVLVAVAVSTAPPPPPPSRAGVRIYGFSVVIMVVAIVAGARVLTSLDRPELVRLWVVLVVGQHFVPFASAFAQPLFARLGWSMVAVAVIGVVLSPVADAAPYAAAVAAGFVLLGFSLWGLVSPAARRAPEVSG